MSSRLAFVFYTAWGEWVRCFRGLGRKRTVIYVCLVLGAICGTDLCLPSVVVPSATQAVHLIFSAHLRS